MKIIMAENDGFCPGVQHAVDVAVRQKEGTYILGEIIHNEGVVKHLGDKGLITVDSLDDVPDGSTVIFRSHGVPLSFYEECKKRAIEVIDCTCHFVQRTQSIVKEKYEKGYTIVIVGDKNHPEVKGLLGWCEENAYVISDENADLSQLKDKDLWVVCQTTFSASKFDDIIKNIRKICEKSVEVSKTICYTTIGRQLETENLAKQCDAMIVIGGLNSSNTNKLCDIAKKYCQNVFRLASSKDLDVRKVANFNVIGIVSGASTPKAQTREVFLNMQENDEEVIATNPMEEVVVKIDNESKFKRGQIVRATISQATEDGLLILLPFSKKEVALSKDELDCEEYDQAAYEAKIGDPIDLMVVDVKPPIKLSEKMIRLLREEEAQLSEIEDGKEFSVVCTGYNKGGLTASLGTYTVFVPAKEIRPVFVKDLTKFVGKPLRLRVIEIKKDKKKEIIASQRVILQEERDAREAEKAAKEEAFFDSINAGDVVEGKVERMTNFGAFVSVKGFDCLAHISDLSWTDIKKPDDVLEIGQTYQFLVLKVDKEKKKVSIGYKQLQPEPWQLAAEKYAVGDTVHGKVVRLVSFGAFVEIEKGIDALVHISQISHERIESPSAVLNIGDEIDAKIIALDITARKMNLSIKALLPEEEPKPRAKREPSEKKEKTKSARPSRRDEDEGMTDWSEGSLSMGTSIADLLKSKEEKD